MRGWLGLVAVCLYLCGCSFLTAATGGSTSVTKTHEYTDVGGMAIAGIGCAVAAFAWANPDMFAPVADDPSSWASPLDRADVQQRGATWTIPACAATAIFLVSGLYGRSVRPADDDPPSPDWGAAAAVGAAFVNGFQAAGQTQPAPVYRAPVYQPPRRAAGCSSDFGCSYGWTCVKPRYSMTGVCHRAVDSSGVQTFDPPDTDSVGPNVPSDDDCSFHMNCPAGFSCDTASGACVR